MADTNAPRTPARSVVIPDDQWDWLDHVRQNLDRGSVLRRLITVMQRDEDGHQHDDHQANVKTHWCVWCRVLDAPDPIAEARTAGLKGVSR